MDPRRCICLNINILILNCFGHVCLCSAAPQLEEVEQGVVRGGEGGGAGGHVLKAVTNRLGLQHVNTEVRPPTHTHTHTHPHTHRPTHKHRITRVSLAESKHASSELLSNFRSSRRWNSCWYETKATICYYSTFKIILMAQWLVIATMALNVVVPCNLGWVEIISQAKRLLFLASKF